MIDLRGKRRGVPSFGQRTRSRETLPIFSPLDTSSGLCVGHAPGPSSLVAARLVCQTAAPFYPCRAPPRGMRAATIVNYSSGPHPGDPCLLFLLMFWIEKMRRQGGSARPPIQGSGPATPWFGCGGQTTTVEGSDGEDGLRRRVGARCAGLG